MMWNLPISYKKNHHENLYQYEASNLGSLEFYVSHLMSLAATRQAAKIPSVIVLGYV